MATRAPASGARLHLAAPPARTGLALITGKYVSITSFRRDGTGVATPVWFVAEGDRLLVMTTAGSGKVKRIRRNPSVTVAPCSARGRLRAAPIAAIATPLPSNEVERVEDLMERKYRIDLVFIRPIRAFQLLLHPERRDEETVILSIAPTGATPR